MPRLAVSGPRIGVRGDTMAWGDRFHVIPHLMRNLEVPANVCLAFPFLDPASLCGVTRWLWWPFTCLPHYNAVSRGTILVIPHLMRNPESTLCGLGDWAPHQVRGDTERIVVQGDPMALGDSYISAFTSLLSTVSHPVISALHPSMPTGVWRVPVTR